MGLIELIITLITPLQHTYHILHAWNELPLHYRWVGTGFILILVELQLRRSITIWPAGAAFVTAIPSMFLSKDTLPLQTTLFFGLTGIGFYLRPLVIAKYVGKEDLHPAPAQRIMGATAECTHKVEGYKRPGAIRLGGHAWTAIEPFGQSIQRHEDVRVIGRRDMTLLVEKTSAKRSKLLKLSGRLIGKHATWIYDHKIILADRAWRALYFPPDDLMGVGQTVKIIGLTAKGILVERDQDFGVDPARIIGMIAVCREAIEEPELAGAANLNGVAWSARSWNGKETIPVGDLVRVVEVDGAVLMVEKLKNFLSA